MFYKITYIRIYECYITCGQLDATDLQIKKALIALAIEKALLDIGEPELDQVSKLLFSKYKCYLPDCVERPDYLKKVLKELYGSTYLTVIKSIKNNLEEFSYQKPVAIFIEALSD